MPLAKCWRRAGYQRARSQATTCHRASVVILVDFVRSKQNGITRRPWSCNQVEMLATNADFPTPGDPLIQMILWPSTLLTASSISCRIVCQVPSIHALHRKSLSPSRVHTKSSSSFCSAPAFAFSIDDEKRELDRNNRQPTL